MRRIVITGTESTGKTELAIQLADYLHYKYIPEYAREYIENLGRPYLVDDVLHIAKRQLHEYRSAVHASENAIFDTWLIITKVWLDLVFHTSVDWIDDAISDSKIDLYLLCSNDLPWVPDHVRENGGEMRGRLFDIYLKVLERNSLPYRVVSGKGEDRFKNAIFAIEEFFKEK